MISKALSSFPYPWLSSLGLVIFFAIFVGVLVWVSRRGGTEFYSRLSQMPLEDLEPVYVRKD